MKIYAPNTDVKKYFKRLHGAAKIEALPSSKNRGTAKHLTGFEFTVTLRGGGTRVGAISYDSVKDAVVLHGDVDCW